jgi:outer membrane protein assembly factor BamB
VEWTLAVRLFTVLAGFVLPAVAWAEQVPSFAETCFDDFDDQHGALSPEALQRLLTPVPGVSGRSGAIILGKPGMVSLAGLFRLSSPWTPDTALRFSADAKPPFQIMVWSGEQGVVLRPGWLAWTAYGVSRHGDAPRPQTWSFWASDDGRFRRSGGGTVELHYQDGSLVLTRGDIALLSAPLPGPPSEILLDGQAQLRGIALFRARGLPPAPTPNPIVLHNEQPAGLAWEEPLVAGMSFRKLEDGRVELAAEPGSQRGRASAAICEAGIYEYFFEVENAEPGTGVFLADALGEPLCRIGFTRDKTNGRTCFLLMPGQATNLDDRHFDFDRQTAPYCGPRQQFRVVLGAGIARAWTSGNGVRWSILPDWGIHAGGQCRRIGLCCFPAKKRRSIKLRSVAIRRLDALEALVAGKFDAGTPLPPESDDAASWLQRVDAIRPTGIAPQVWRRACIVRLLAACRNVKLGQLLLHGLLDDMLDEPLAWETRVRLLQQAGLMMDLSDFNNGSRQTAYYERLGRILLQNDGHAAFTRIVHLALELPAWSHNSNKLEVFPPELLRYELLSAVYRQRWADVDALCRRLQYWNPSRRYAASPNVPGYLTTMGYLLDWAQAEAAWYMQSPPDGGKGVRSNLPVGPTNGQQADLGPSMPGASHKLDLTPFPRSAGHPLLERLNKEGYTLAAEFQAALASRSYREACQIIAGTSNLPAAGLVPSPADPALMTSLGVMMEAAVRDLPPLRAMMEEHGGSLGQLRVKQAIAAGQAEAVEAVCTQFPGTRAAAEAHLWLADRELSAGRIAAATAVLEAALETAAAEQRPAIEARLRLAGALAGVDRGRPVEEPVQLGARQIPAAAFELMVAAVRRRHAPGATAAGLSLPAFPPGSYACHAWARFIVADVQRWEKPAWLEQTEFDWVGYQIRTLQSEQALIVAYPTRLAAFDLRQGRQLWSYPGPASSIPLWPPAPMQPIVVGERIIVRRPMDRGVLMAVDRRDGQVLWTSDLKGEEVLSDPVWLEPDLFALTAARTGHEEFTLQWTRFDPASGMATARHPLLELRNVWSGTIPTEAIPCQVIAVGDRIVVNAGGCVLSADADGRVRWLRRQTYLPWPKDSHYSASVRAVAPLDPPLVFEGRVYAMQPGGWSLECADVRSGQLLWRQVLPELRRLLGVVGGRLLVSSATQLLALDPRSGQPLWSRATDPRSALTLTGPSGAIVVFESQPAASAPAGQPKLVWLDGASGAVVHTAALRLPSAPAVQSGPLVFAADRCWGFFAAEPDGFSREIVELTRGE